MCFLCQECQTLNFVQFLLSRQIGVKKTTARSVTRRFGSKVVLARILSGALVVTGPLILSLPNGVLPEVLETVEEMEETPTLERELLPPEERL
ncbi:MAG: ORF2 [Etatorquevirus sp.]|nr:MAG: ORF2 [Etatorquevirus sp.]